MITKEAQIDYLQWVLTYCKQFTFDTIIVKDEKIKKYLEIEDQLFYLDSVSDMEKLYQLYTIDKEADKEKYND